MNLSDILNVRQQQWVFVGGWDSSYFGRGAAEWTAHNDAGNGERAALNVTLHLGGRRTSLGAEAWGQIESKNEAGRK